MVCDMVRGWDKRGKVKLWMLCVNGKVDESGQIRLLTFRENTSRRMRGLGLGNCSFGCWLTKEVGLAQFGAIELQLWVTNRDWVMIDPVEQ